MAYAALRTPEFTHSSQTNGSSQLPGVCMDSQASKLHSNHRLSEDCPHSARSQGRLTPRLTRREQLPLNSAERLFKAAAKSRSSSSVAAEGPSSARSNRSSRSNTPRRTAETWRNHGPVQSRHDVATAFQANGAKPLFLIKAAGRRLPPPPDYAEGVFNQTQPCASSSSQHVHDTSRPWSTYKGGSRSRSSSFPDFYEDRNMSAWPTPNLFFYGEQNELTGTLVGSAFDVTAIARAQEQPRCCQTRQKAQRRSRSLQNSEPYTEIDSASNFRALLADRGCSSLTTQHSLSSRGGSPA